MTDSSSVTPQTLAAGAPITADEYLHALAQLDAAMAQVVRRAGQGCGPDCERRLDQSSRGLRALLGPDCTDVVTDVIDAARLVLTAADPSAPQMMLTMARQTLAAVVHRQAARATRKVA